MKINGGIIIGSETFKTKKTIENKFAELRQIIFNTKKRYNSISNQIISNISLFEIIPDGVKCHVPKYGDKNKLINYDTLPIPDLTKYMADIELLL